MDHSEAVQQMAAERYLLDELTPDAREAFEAHLFDCPDCALDLRAGAAFVEEAKVQLPGLTAAAPAPIPVPSPRAQESSGSGGCPGFSRPLPRRSSPPCCWLSVTRTWLPFRRCGLQPASRGFFPGLRCAGPRGAGPMTIAADYRHGVALPVVLPPQPSPGAYASYSFELYDPQGKLAWTGLAAPPDDEASDLAGLSLVIPGAMLRNGAYTLAVSGIAAHGERTEIDKYVFNLHLTD